MDALNFKKFKNFVLNLVNFSKFEGIPSWIWLLFFGAWLQLFGLFWMVTGTQEFSAGPSEFLPDLHFLCKIVLKPSNVIPLLLF
jgi:hypothetical protein